MPQPRHILIVGGGYVGMYAARRLEKKLHAGEARITVVDPQPTMTYQPFLAEAAAGSIEPRHVVVPLRRVLRRSRVLTGSVTRIEHARRVAVIALPDGETTEIDYDDLVMAAGSVARTLPIPGLAEHGIGFKTVGEAIYLRNHVLGQLDSAAAAKSPETRRAALTFVVVGGGYSGVEIFAELEDMARSALRYYPDVEAREMRWVLVEAADRIMPEVSRSLSNYTAERLTERGMDIRLNTRVSSMVERHVVLSDGDEFDAHTIVWTAGVRANPLASRSGLPVDSLGRLLADATLQVQGVEGVWAAGDSAAVPDLSAAYQETPDTRERLPVLCGPTAQHAVRQAKRLADNLALSLRGAPPRPYRHANAGSVASLGLHKGVAEIYGIKLRGFPAWFLHRTYHLLQVPTLNRKVRVVLDWTLALFFRRDVVSLGQVHQPRLEWEASNSWAA